MLQHPELDLGHYGLTRWDLDREFLTDGLPGPRKQPLRTIIDTLRDAYCRTIGVEYMHISEPEREALDPGARRGAAARSSPCDEKKHILDRLNAAEAFERFLHSKYTGTSASRSRAPRASSRCSTPCSSRRPSDGHVEVVMGMAHRGRLNVLANIVGKPLQEIFKEFEGDIDPDTVQGSGDVKYHLGMTGRFTSACRQRHRSRSCVEPESPRGRRSGRRGHGTRQTGSAR